MGMSYRTQFPVKIEWNDIEKHVDGGIFQYQKAQFLFNKSAFSKWDPI